MKPWAKLLLPSISETVFLSVFLLLALRYGHALLQDGDTGYHIRTGEFILKYWAIPKQDIFSFRTPAIAWTAHEWLSEIIMAVIHGVTGLTGIVIFFSFILASTYLLLYRIVRRESQDTFLAVVVVLFAAISSAPHWLARPHLFSLTLTVIWYHILNEFQYRQKNLLFLFLPLILLWVNLHGGYILGVLLLGIYLAGNLLASIGSRPADAQRCLQNSKLLLLTMTGCILVSMINPQGYRILLFPFELTSDMYIMDHVQEFLSPNFHHPLPFKYLLLLTIGLLALARPPVNWIELMLVLTFAYMALYSVRHIPLFAIITAPILIKLINRIKGELPVRVVRFLHERNRRIAEVESQTRGCLWSILGVSAVVSLASVGGYRYKFSEKTLPVSAVEFLKRENMPGNIFSHDGFGDYLIYAAWPQYKVFIDGRTDMYGADRVRESLALAWAMPGWKETLDKHSISAILFDTHSTLSGVLAEDKRWHLVYSDPIASLFVRVHPQNQRLIDKYPLVTLAVDQRTASK